MTIPAAIDGDPGGDETERVIGWMPRPNVWLAVVYGPAPASFSESDRHICLPPLNHLLRRVVDQNRPWLLREYLKKQLFPADWMSHDAVEERHRQLLR